MGTYLLILIRIFVFALGTNAFRMLFVKLFGKFVRILELFEAFRTSEKKKGEITRAHLYEDGFIGKDTSRERRKALAKKVNLPENISTTALIEALNIILKYEDYIKICEELK